MNHIKCVVVGDGTVGKTSMIITYMTNSFPQDFLPAVFDNYSTSTFLQINGKNVIPEIIDTIDVDDKYKEKRKFLYNEANVFIICFSLISPLSMKNAQTIWANEIKEKYPNVPFILVGTKSDLRDNFSQEDNSKGFEPISTSTGKKVKKQIGAKEYIECSSLKQINVREVFESAFSIGMEYHFKHKKP